MYCRKKGDVMDIAETYLQQKGHQNDLSAGMLAHSGGNYSGTDSTFYKSQLNSLKNLYLIGKYDVTGMNSSELNKLYSQYKHHREPIHVIYTNIKGIPNYSRK